MRQLLPYILGSSSSRKAEKARVSNMECRFTPPPYLHLITNHLSYLTLLLALATSLLATSCGEDEHVLPDVPDVPDVPEPDSRP